MYKHSVIRGENTVETREYTYHNDPSHGWLEIPLTELKGLNIQVSKYSYHGTNNAYLEEDHDAGLAITALKNSGINPTFNEVNYNNSCFIRELYRFGITEIRSPGLNITQC